MGNGGNPLERHEYFFEAVTLQNCMEICSWMNRKVKTFQYLKQSKNTIFPALFSPVPIFIMDITDSIHLRPQMYAVYIPIQADLSYRISSHLNFGYSTLELSLPLGFNFVAAGSLVAGWSMKLMASQAWET